MQRSIGVVVPNGKEDARTSRGHGESKPNPAGRAHTKNDVARLVFPSYLVAKLRNLCWNPRGGRGLTRGHSSRISSRPFPPRRQTAGLRGSRSSTQERAIHARDEAAACSEWVLFAASSESCSSSYRGRKSQAQKEACRLSAKMTTARWWNRATKTNLLWNYSTLTEGNCKGTERCKQREGILPAGSERSLDRRS